MEPCDLTATEARALIGAKKLSPVELLESCLARIDKVNAPVNAIVAMNAERARAEARAAEQAVMRGDPLGALHGLPIAVKDVVDTAGLRTTYGSLVFRDYVPAHDERPVAALRQAGAIVWMKANTPEWAAGGNTFNPVYGVSGNPFAPHLSCAGSSGGSAVALATGMVPLAYGSDNAGSLRIPGAVNGVVGMRPSGGLVASETRPFGPSHFHVDGPMARTARDTLLMLCAMASDDSRDPLAGHLDAALRADAPPIDLATLRVAISPNLGGFAPIEPSLRKLFEARVASFAGIFKSSAAASPDFTGADSAYTTIRALNFVGTWHDRFRESPDKLGRLVTQNYHEGLKLTVEEIAAAYMQQTRIYRGAQSFFNEFDLLITPTVGVYAWPKHDIYPARISDHPTANYFDWVRMTYGITLINHPAISIPCGRDDRGLPFGLQLVAPRGQDAFLMQAAIALEQVFARNAETARPVPDVEWLARQPADDPLARPVR